MLRARFQLVAVFILAFWLVMMALLVRREILIPRAADHSFQASAVPEVPKNSWMGIYLADGSQIGYIHSTSTPDVRDGEEGALLSLDVSVRTKVLGDVMPVKITGDAWASATRGLRDFDFAVRSGGHVAGVKAVIDDGKVDAQFEVNGEPYPIEWTVDEDLFLWSGMGASNVYFPAMEEGDAFIIDAFDPVTLSKSPVMVRCVGTEPIRIGDAEYVAKVVEMEYETMTARAHIDAETGDVLRAETPLGITLQRIDPSQAVQGLLEEDATGLLSLTLIAADGLTPRAGLKRMVVRLSGLDPWVEVPTSENQRAIDAESHTYRVTVPATAPDQRARAIPESLPARLREDLQNAQTAWEQVSHMAAFSAGATDPARRFKEFAAKAGFEVRLVSGAAWSPLEGAFQYQVWPEVLLDRWYWVDPLQGRFPADAARIQLGTSADEWPRLVGLFPRMHIEVLEQE